MTSRLALFINSFVDDPEPIYLTGKIFKELFPNYSINSVCDILGLSCNTETISGRKFLAFTVKQEDPDYATSDESL